MNLKSLFFVSIALTLFMAGCGNKRGSNQNPSDPECPIALPNSQMCGALSWTDGPRATNVSRARLTLWEKDRGGPRGPFRSPSETIQGEIQMACGCALNGPFQMIRTSDGRYDLDGIRFPSPGTWRLHLTVRHLGRQDQTQISFEVQ